MALTTRRRLQLSCSRAVATFFRPSRSTARVRSGAPLPPAPALKITAFGWMELTREAMSPEVQVSRERTYGFAPIASMSFELHVS